MKRLALIAAALLCLSATAALADMISGVVVEDGMSSIRVKDDAGKELRLHTAKGMVYVPADYRAYSGDKVAVTYVMENRKGESIAVIKELKMVAEDPKNKMMESPQAGRIEEMGRRGAKVYIKSKNEVFTFENQRGTPEVPNALKDPKAGDEVKVFFSRIPVHMETMNRYAWILHGFQKN